MRVACPCFAAPTPGGQEQAQERRGRPGALQDDKGRALADRRPHQEGEAEDVAARNEFPTRKRDERRGGRDETHTASKTKPKPSQNQAKTKDRGEAVLGAHNVLTMPSCSSPQRWPLVQRRVGPRLPISPLPARGALEAVDSSIEKPNEEPPLKNPMKSLH
eukprot:63577-Chlamydomonas_euryale.AAC.1